MEMKKMHLKILRKLCSQPSFVTQNVTSHVFNNPKWRHEFLTTQNDVTCLLRQKNTEIDLKNK